MDICESHQEMVLGNDPADQMLTGIRLAKFAIIIVILTAPLGCQWSKPDDLDAEKAEKAEAAVKAEKAEKAEAAVNGVEPVDPVVKPEQATVAPSVQPHNATDPIDLEPAIQETREIFGKHALPEDWYQTLTANFDNNHSVLVSAIWAMVGPEVATRFQKRFDTARRPSGRVSTEEVHGDNIVFDELLHRVLRGDEHGAEHAVYVPNFSVESHRLPNVNPQFLKRDGAVAFGKLQTALVAELQTGTDSIVVDENETAANDSEEWCRVVAQWRRPDGLTGWAAEQFVWRPVIRVEFVEGDRVQGNVVSKGDRRLVLSCYAQVGFRESDIAPATPIYLAGPYVESNYQPVGDANGSEQRFTMTMVTRLCPQDRLTYGDLVSLNAELTEREQQQAEAAAADPRPASEIPNPMWIGGSGFAEPLRAMHQKLGRLIQSP